MKKEIVIRCTAADTRAIDELIEFQGGIKKLPKKKYEQLKNSILNRGFIAPIFVWDDCGIFRILDGHSRLKVLTGLREDGYSIPLLPVVYIKADSEQEAKSMLLSIASQYGEFVIEELEDFSAGLDLEDFSFDLNIDNEILDVEIESKVKKEKLVPFEKIHFLISCDVNLYPEVKNIIDQIKIKKGIEVEQSAN